MTQGGPQLCATGKGSLLLARGSDIAGYHLPHYATCDVEVSLLALRTVNLLSQTTALHIRKLGTHWNQLRRIVRQKFRLAARSAISAPLSSNQLRRELQPEDVDMSTNFPALSIPSPTPAGENPPSTITTPTAIIHSSYDPDLVPPKPSSGVWTRFVCISDTHEHTFDVPHGDVLLHSGQA